MYTIKKGWREVTDGKIYDLFMEVLEALMEDADLWALFQKTHRELPRLFIHKSIRALGECYNHRNYDGTYSTSILLSEYILECAPEKVRGTLVHEVGHMLAPNDHHGYYWHVRTNRLGRKWGYNATRLETDAEMIMAMSAARKAVKSVGYKYELVCPKCNKVCGQYKSMCNAVKYPSRWRHKACGTTLVSRTVGGM